MRQNRARTAGRFSNRIALLFMSKIVPTLLARAAVHTLRSNVYVDPSFFIATVLEGEGRGANPT